MVVISECMVGTAEYHDGRGLAFINSSRKVAGSKALSRMTEPPEASELRRFADIPPMWNRGIAFSAQSEDVKPRFVAIAIAFATMLCIKRGTIFGSLVVPLVRRITALLEDPFSNFSQQPFLSPVASPSPLSHLPKGGLRLFQS